MDHGGLFYPFVAMQTWWVLNDDFDDPDGLDNLDDLDDLDDLGSAYEQGVQLRAETLPVM